MQIEDIDITLQRKRIRSIRLSITSGGEVRLSVPLSLKESEARSFAKTKLSWIRIHLDRINSQKALEPEDFSSILFLGEIRKTEFTYKNARQNVCLDEKGIIHISIRPAATTDKIRKLLDKWYAKQLETLIEPLVNEWETMMDVKVSSFRFRHMKTRWGTCNVITHQIVLNTELAKKSFPCIEYILVHEMAHLIERGHGPRFKAVMDKYLPHWKALRKELNGKGL
jgi:predicted metal-dependent hydrolase